MRIVLVEPQPDSRSAIARWLDEFFGHVQIESAALGGIELGAIVKARPNPPAVVVMTSGCAAGFDLQCKAAGVDLRLEKRHLQARLLDFLQKRFPET